MSIIYCGKSNNKPYYIKEADVNIYSIEQLAYFIYNYAMLISNNFICKNLIIYIERVLGLIELASKINEKYNKKESLAEILTLILENSNYYNIDEIQKFQKNLLKLMSYSENDYINLAGDSLFLLDKYEKAITQYSKISKNDNNALLKLGFCYAKLQFYDNATIHLGELYNKVKDEMVLKNIYYCLKLNSTTEKIYEFEPDVKEERLAEWEFNIVSLILTVRKKDEMKEKEGIFLMGNNYIKQNALALIKMWKEKYRYIG